jgi:phosphoglycolate phosphatase
VSRLIVFDFDGTLANSFPWFCDVLNDVARRHGFREVRPDEREELRNLGARDILRSLDVPMWKVPRIARDMRAMKQAADIPLFEHVPDVLGKLRAKGARLAIVSSDSEPSIRRTLGAETSALFEGFFCGASLFGKARKLRQAARTAGISSADAVYVGDEIRDADAARDAGLKFAAVTWGYSSRQALLSCAPDIVLDDVADIARLAGGEA